MNRSNLGSVQEKIERPILDNENQKILEEIQFARRKDGIYAKKGNFCTITLKIEKEKFRQLLNIYGGIQNV